MTIVILLIAFLLSIALLQLAIAIRYAVCCTNTRIPAALLIFLALALGWFALNLPQVPAQNSASHDELELDYSILVFATWLSLNILAVLWLVKLVGKHQSATP
jgi:hypothetical protein